MGRILRKGTAQLRLIAEQIDDLLIGAKTEGTDQDRDRHLSGAVHTDPEDIIGIGLVLQPCATVRNHLAAVEGLAVFILVNAVVDARRTDQLRDNDTLCAVDDERTGLGHQGQIAHEDLLLLHVLGIFLVVKTDLDLERRSVGGIAFLALCDRVLVLVHLVSPQLIADERKGKVTGIVLDGGDIFKYLLEALVKEPLVG